MSLTAEPNSVEMRYGKGTKHNKNESNLIIKYFKKIPM